MLDLFVSGVATGALQPTLDLSKEAWNPTPETSVRVFLGAGLACPLLTQGGSIVSISSSGYPRCIPGQAAVGASKAALESLTRAFAVEFAHGGIPVNCVPGRLTGTDAFPRLPARDRMHDVTTGRTPLGRIGHPEDIAHVVALPCAVDARGITEQVIAPDGGFSLM